MSTFKMKGWSPFTQVDPDITQDFPSKKIKQQMATQEAWYKLGEKSGYAKGKFDVMKDRNLAMQKSFEAGRGGFWKRMSRRFWPAAIGIAAWEGIKKYKQSQREKKK